MKLSLITATHKRPQKLSQKALPSLLKQNNSNFEWIVVNDGACPQTREVIQSQRTQFQLNYLEMSHPTTGFGLGHARNLGLKAASGELIAYLDDDNSFCPDFVEKILEVFERNPQFKCCLPQQYRGRTLISNGIVVKTGQPFISPSREADVSALIRQEELFDSNGFVHHRDGAPCWNPQYRIFCDYEYFLQCLSLWGGNSFYLLPIVLVNYIQTSEGVIGQSNYNEWAKELQHLLNNASNYKVLTPKNYQEALQNLGQHYQKLARKKLTIPAFSS